ncbi:hypothetical protein ACJX0J_017479 [Zea mays]
MTVAEEDLRLAICACGQQSITRDLYSFLKLASKIFPQEQQRKGLNSTSRQSLMQEITRIKPGRAIYKQSPLDGFQEAVKDAWISIDEGPLLDPCGNGWITSTEASLITLIPKKEIWMNSVLKLLG